MKRIFLIAILSAIAICAIAQDSDTRSSYFGLRANLDLLRIGNSPDDVYEGDFGANVGAVYNIPIARRFFAEPALYGFYNRFSPAILSSEQTVLYARAMQAGIRGILNFGYHFGQSPAKGLRIALGPMVNLPFVGRTSDLHPIGEIDYQYSHDLYSPDCLFYQKRFNVAVNLQISYIYYNWEFTFSNSKGLLNLSQIPNHIYRNSIDQNNLCVGIGYNFR